MDMKDLRLDMAKELQPWLAKLNHARKKRRLPADKKKTIKGLFRKGMKVRADFVRLYAADHGVHDTKKITLKAIIRRLSTSYQGKAGKKRKGKGHKKTKKKLKPEAESLSATESMHSRLPSHSTEEDASA